MKQYPPSMCKALAKGLCDVLLPLETGQGESMPPYVKAVVSKLRAQYDPYDPDTYQHKGHDFAGLT